MRGRARFGKFNAKRTADGFPSKLEASVYQLLLLRERCGEIKEIKRQCVIRLLDGPKDVMINWKCDFSYINCSTGVLHYCEAKGVRTNDFILKLKLYKATQSAPLEIYSGDYRRPTLTERINYK